MRIASLLKALGIGAATAAVTTAVAERLVLRRIDTTPSPEGWTNPTWPDGRELMVPTDDGAELVVEITGPDDAPTLMLIHGLSGDHDSFGLVADGLLERGFRVIGLNQRGHGGSTVGTEGFGAERQGADVGQVLRALGLEDVTVVGHSMGGVAILALLTLRPETGADRVRAVTLVATLAQATRADRDRSLRIGESDFYRRMAEHPVHGTAMARWIFGRTPSRRMVDDVMDVGRRCPEETRIGAALGMLGYDVREHLAGIDVPTAVICGTRDVITRHSENEDIADAIPGATFTSVPGAGHMIIWEEPEIIVDTAAALAEAPAVSADV